MTTLDSQRGDRDAAVVVAAGGAGVRLGAGPPKALRPLAGEPLLVHAVRRLTAASSVGLLVIAAPPGHERAVAALVNGAVVVTGGAERQTSVAAALAAVPPEFPIVLVHDAARALTPPSLVDQVAAAVRAGHDAVIPVLPVVDTITQVDAAGQVVATPDRSALRAVQTPQGFRRSVLEAAHAAAGAAATDDAGLVARLGVPVHTVPGSPAAMKVTTWSDLLVAEALLHDRMSAMTITRHNPEAAPPVAKYSQVVRVDLDQAALLFVSGIVGVDPAGELVGDDLVTQADQIYANLEAVLASQGAGLEHVVKVTTFLKEGVDRTALRSRQRFPDHSLPAATLVFVSALADAAYLLEVEAVAVVPRGR